MDVINGEEDYDDPIEDVISSNVNQDDYNTWDVEDFLHALQNVYLDQDFADETHKSLMAIWEEYLDDPLAGDPDYMN
jgi:hypothetical protein